MVKTSEHWPPIYPSVDSTFIKIFATFASFALFVFAEVFFFFFSCSLHSHYLLLKYFGANPKHYVISPWCFSIHLIKNVSFLFLAFYFISNIYKSNEHNESNWYDLLLGKTPLAAIVQRPIKITFFWLGVLKIWKEYFIDFDMAHVLFIEHNIMKHHLSISQF